MLGTVQGGEAIMPRGPRIDYPGALQHVIFRGLNRMAIFKDDHDRLNLLARFKKVFPQSGVKLYAWVLMDNHVHLLLKSGHEPIGNVMKRILTGYAQYFNRKYGRCGYVFQGRFKSTICDSEVYFQTLTRYIHLNPYRAGIVNSLKELAAYRWSGHIALIGGCGGGCFIFLPSEPSVPFGPDDKGSSKEGLAIRYVTPGPLGSPPHNQPTS